jgi:hypothetical protein
MYKDDEFRLFCGQLDALALLPLWEVHEGMQYIKQTMPEAAEPLVDYFDRTYVSGRLRQRPQQQHEDQENVPPIRIRRTPPAFPPQKWNMHQVTLDDQPHTNNISEGWNNKFSSLVGEQHPSVWKLIETLQQECERVATIFYRMKEVSVQQKSARKCIQNFKNVSVTFVKTEHLVTRPLQSS